MVRLFGVFLLVTAACGNITRKTDERPDDAGVHDAPDAKVIDDAMLDAPPIDAPPIPPQSRETVSGAGHLTSTNYILDVQIGNPYSQKQTAGSTTTAEGNASVKP
jgi:hypothetical protein